MLAQAISRLRQLGVRITPQRQEVLRVLLEGKQPSTAEEILKKVRSRYPRVSQDTIYRTLATFKKLGLVNELHFSDRCRRFEINIRGDHHHHMVCIQCGNAWKLPDCPLECLMRAKNYYPDFQIEDHSFVIYGYCPKCRGA
ncbi:MAG: Ferric uptake regulator, Fur family [Thermoanaerobacterales bacterium 50_218]|nr:MAG: Ferric uptake regulator, Fur family [Thermoanaerobacterales bacterium 50_218]HAA90620.1 transcriptional repressor [Peptococcaceae bacterium]